MTTITVSTAAELENALVKATGGETILLEGGDYGKLDLGEWQTVRALFPSEVILRSADPADPAVFTGMFLRDVSNMTFEGVKFDYTFDEGHPEWLRPFRAGGENIAFRDCEFSGDLASGTGGPADGHGSGYGLSMNGDTVTVENCEFYDWWKALAIGGTDVTIRGNDIHSIRSDGINLVDAQGALVEDNHIHDFDIAWGTGDHADMLQMWILKPEMVSTDIIIRNNLFDIGEGGPTQSIFLGNEAARAGGGEEVYYRNILIEGNVVLNAHLHGITVGETDGLVIRDNTVLQKVTDDVSDPTHDVTYPRINVSGGSLDVVIEGNVTHKVPSDLQPTRTVLDNIIAQNKDVLLPNYYDALLEGYQVTAGQMPVLKSVSPVTEPIVESETVSEPVLLSRPVQEPASAPEAVTKASDGNSLVVTLSGGTPLGAESGALIAQTGQSFELGAAGAAVLSGDAIARIYEAGAFSMDFTLAANGVGVAGEVFHMMSGIRVKVASSGDLVVTLSLKDGTHEQAVVRGAGLNDGSAHDVRLDYDAEARTFAITVDGETAKTMSLDAPLSGSKQMLLFGDFWGAENFDGTLTRFDVSLNGPAPTAPVAGEPSEEPAAEPAPEPPVEEGRADLASEAIFRLSDMDVGDLKARGSVDVSSGGDRGAPLLDFDGGYGVLGLGRLDKPQLDGSLTADIVIDPGDMSGRQHLLWNHMNFGVEIAGSELRVFAHTEDEGFKSYRTSSAPLEVDGEHRIIVAVASDLDRIQIVIDGEVVLDQIDEGLNIAARGTDAYDWGWSFGVGWDSGIDGTVSEIALYDDALFHDAANEDLGLIA